MKRWASGQLRRWQRRLGLCEPCAVVLAYHRVASVRRDPQKLCVRPERFTEQMAVLQSQLSATTVRGLAGAVRDRAMSRTMVVVTFDDGYADNLHNALPVLRAHRVPATVFVTSGAIGAVAEFDWDQLERLLLDQPSDARSLDLHIGGRDHHFDLRHDGPPACDPAFDDWDVTQGADPTPAHGAYREIHRLLKPLTLDARCAVLESIAEQLDVDSEGRVTHRPMTADELRALADDPLIEIGAHTVTHPQLSSLPAEDQTEELRRSRYQLEAAIGQSVRSASYPYGGRADYTAWTLEAAAKAGFDQACGNVPGRMTADQSLYSLPRCLVRDWDGAEFARRLDAMFDLPCRDASCRASGSGQAAAGRAA